MKSMILIIAGIISLQFNGMAQQTNKALTASVAALDKASTIADYQALANDFKQISTSQKTDWLPWYYAAFCNAKMAWLNEDDGEKIEPFARLADEQAKQALSLLDTTHQKEALSELYCVFSMANRAMVFINPATYGRQYGPKAGAYVQLALKANPENPRALYIAGWEKYATPKAWGGDKVKAKALLAEAKQKLDNNTAFSIQPHWGKLEVATLLKQIK